MTEFLNEMAAQQTIQSMLQNAGEADLAVAFWGAQALDLLGLRHEWRNLRIICNLDSGACNPSAIRELMTLPGRVEVRSNPRLHAKLYKTADALVLGSSNASSNGLAVDGNQLLSWAEANVFMTEPSIIQETRNWFDEQFASAYVVTEDHLAKAQQLWDSRSKFAPSGLQMQSDLFEAVRNTYDHTAWRAVKVVFYNGNVSPEGERELASVLEKHPSFAGLGYYDGWGETLQAGDWIIDIDLRRRRPKFTGYWSVHTPKLATQHLTFARQESAIFLPSFGALTVSKEDQERLLRLLQSEESHGAVEISEIVKSLEESAEPKEPPTLAAFQRAMYKIYDEAAEVGYRPTEFRHMIDRDGGLLAAKKLIAALQPSTGFVRLWKLGRLDLTVEALVLQPRWSPLFSSGELERARFRLRQYEG